MPGDNKDKTMNTDEYLELMRFPMEWKECNLVPDEDFIKEFILALKPHQEHVPEHYRHEAFHYWLVQRPATDVLEKLTNLTYADPDQELGKSIRAEILKQPNCSDELRQLISKTR